MEGTICGNAYCEGDNQDDSGENGLEAYNPGTMWLWVPSRGSLGGRSVCWGEYVLKIIEVKEMG